MYNLRQNRHDKITELFIDGTITYIDFECYECCYDKIKYVFTICLN